MSLPGSPERAETAWKPEPGTVGKWWPITGSVPADREGLIGELRDLNVSNVEMEASAILTVAAVYGLRAGAVCAVYADRATGEFGVTGERKAVETASLAVHLLAEMERQKRDAGADHWHPGLSLQ